MDSHKVSMESTTPEEDIRQLLRVTLNREGGDPSLLLELLSRVVEMRIWERFDMSFVKFIETPYDEGGVGWSRHDVETVLKLTHRYEKPGNIDAEMAERLAAMRETVKEELDKALEPTKENHSGANQYTAVSDISDTKPSQVGGTSRDYTIARLKRDDPDLAQQVIDGEISAAEARRRAGWETKKIAIRLDDPASAAATIVKNMPKEQIDELISLLLKAIHEL